MRWPRRHGLWITLAFLALVLCLLGALQYRWIGEIGRAEGERRQAQLDRSARRFADGLDRELGQAMMRQRVGPGERDRRPLLLERLAPWPRSEQAPLVSQVSRLAFRPGGDVTLETCAPDGSSCQPGEWTPQLDLLRRRLLATRDNGAASSDAGIHPGQIIEAPLALLFPLLEMADRPPASDRPAALRIKGLVLVQLDARYLTSKFLPQLAEQHFGPLRESEFVVSVVRRADRAPLYSSDPAAAAGRKPGDLELPLAEFRRQGPDQSRAGERHFPGWLFRTSREPERGAGAPPWDDAPWLLVVRHRGGSLEQAVEAIRRRNLAISLGVLALLGAAAIMLAIGAQRARELARQQIELVASVTHELNTPLAAIRSAGQNLAHGIITDPEQVRRYGTLIDHEGSRLTGLVAQVLDFAGIQSASKPYASEPVSLARVVDDVLADLGLVLEQSGLTVSKDVPAELPEITGDAAALRRVVANLLTNAVKFAASGNRVAISGRRAPDGAKVVLRVEDAGPGIPHAERARVFEPFYRGAAAQRNDLPGAGLGLALVRRIVTAHGGRAAIESVAGGGTAVVVELPTATGREAP